MEHEWTLLSNSISLLGETDLLAFDEDLHNDVCWDQLPDDDTDDQHYRALSSPALSILRGSPSPSTEPAQSPQRKRRQEQPSTPPAVRRKAAKTVGSAAKTVGSRQGQRAAAQKGTRPGRPKTSPSAQLSPSRFLCTETDEVAPPPVARADARKAPSVGLMKALIAPRTRPGFQPTRPSSNGLVRRISFSTPSPQSEEMRRSMQNTRYGTPSLMRSASPFVTIKPPPASLESLRIINRMVNKRVHEARPKRGSSIASKAAAMAAQQQQQQQQQQQRQQQQQQQLQLQPKQRSPPRPAAPVPALEPKIARPSPTRPCGKVLHAGGKVLQRFGRLGGSTLLPHSGGGAGLLSDARQPFHASAPRSIVSPTGPASRSGSSPIAGLLKFTVDGRLAC